MLLNCILLLLVIIVITLLIRQLRKPKLEKDILPVCKFSISKPKFETVGKEKRATYRVFSYNKDRYFRDFPISFKFYSTEKFRSKIKIMYTSSGDDEIETIYDRVVEFDTNTKCHIYYINDVIIGSIDIEIYVDSYYGSPTILFELLQNNMCHMIKEHKLEIVFPK
jgi:hypothetical protein